MKTCSAAVLTLPLPRSPEVCQSSMIFRSLIGTTVITGQKLSSGPGAGATAMIICHWLCSAPLMKPHLPVSTIPPSTGMPMPVGLSVPHSRAPGSAKISSCTSSGSRHAIHVVIALTAATQAAEPSPLATSPSTSMTVRALLSRPP